MNRIIAGLYWNRLKKLLATVPLSDFVKLVWSLDAIANGNTKGAAKHLIFPPEAVSAAPEENLYIKKWYLETLLNEYFYWASWNVRERKKTLNCSHWSAYAKLHNSLYNLEKSEDLIDVKDGKIIDAMPRIAWRTFPWQVGFSNAAIMYKSWYVFNFKESQDFFYKKYGISLEKFTQLGFAVYSQLRDFAGINIETDYSVIGIDAKTRDIAIEMLAAKPAKLSKIGKKIRNPLTPTAYRASIFRNFPGIITTSERETSAYFPIPELVILRVTDGLYYDLVQDDEVAKIIGTQFEKYVFDIVAHYLGGSVAVKDELSWDRDQRRTPDLRLFEAEKVSLVIECKAKRLPMVIRSSADPFEENPEHFEQIAKGIAQIWSYCSDVRLNKVPGETKLSSNVVGIVLTLDPWLDMGANLRRGLLTAAERIFSEYADNSNVDKIPVTVVSFEDFERTLISADLRSLIKALHAHSSEEFFGWHLYNLHEQMNTEDAPPEPVEMFDYKGKLVERLNWWRDHFGRSE